VAPPHTGKPFYCGPPAPLKSIVPLPSAMLAATAGRAARLSDCSLAEDVFDTKNEIVQDVATTTQYLQSIRTVSRVFIPILSAN
jgi:hypothetical protein